MTPSAQQLIAELDAALGSAQVKRRVAIMRKVTDPYIEGSSTFTEEQIAFFDIVMKLLAQRVGREALIELVGLLANTDNAPPTRSAALHRTMTLRSLARFFRIRMRSSTAFSSRSPKAKARSICSRSQRERASMQSSPTH